VLLPAEDRHLLGERLRPQLLREMAFTLLKSQQRSYSARSENNAGHALRLVTYNVHSCLGLDGRLSPRRIARVLAALDPDVVALQELDVGRTRSGGVDQAHVIAEALAMDLHFLPCLEISGEKYGNAVLSRLPMQLMRADSLPSFLPACEPRGALWVRIEQNGEVLNVITTHLGLHPQERQHQIDALLGPDWLSHPECQGPVVLCGDFNCGPRSAAYRRLSRVIRDAQRDPGLQPQRTWFSPWPLTRIDYVFVSGHIAVTNVGTAQGQLARVASDHLPVVAELILSRSLELQGE